MTPRLAFLISLGLAAVVLLPALGALPLIDPDEGRYAGAARRMADEGLALTPWFNGEPRFAKPAPITWIQGLSLRWLGDNELALRLPGALLAGGAVLVTHGAAARLGGPWAGLIAGAMLATSFRFAAVARQGLVDAPLTLAMAAAMASLLIVVTGSESERGPALARAHVAMALGTLLKGPIAFLLPWVALVVYAAAARRSRLLAGARVGRAVVVFLAVASPYFLAMVAVHGRVWLDEVIVRQHFERFRGIGFGQPSERGVDYFWRVLPGDLLPWTPLLVVAIILTARAWGAHSDQAREAHRFLWSLAVVIVALFSLSRFKLPHYVLPAFAPLAVSTGLALTRNQRGQAAIRLGTVLGLLTLAVVGLLGQAYLETLALADTGWSLAAVAVAAGLAAVATRWVPVRMAPLGLALVTALAYLVLAAGIAPKLAARYRPERALAAAAPAGARLGLYGLWSSAFIHYAGRRVELVPDRGGLERFAAAPGRAVVLCPEPPPAEVLASGGRRLAAGWVLSPRISNLWRARPPAGLALYEVGR